MPWRYPTDDRHVPKGGEFLSTVLDTGARRSLPHSGLDYSRYAGSPVYAIGPGTVIKQGTSRTSGWGLYTYIDHGDVGGGRHAYSYYAHKAEVGPAVGTRLNGGEKIGTIGATGSGITGAHLHWGVAVCTPAQFASTVFPMGSAARALLVDPEGFVAARVGPSAPNERQVKSNANAFRRMSPDAGAALTPKDNRLDAGSTHTITKAYLTGKPITQNGTTTDIWFEVAAYGWAWAGGFTSQSLDGIPSVIDARPKPPPVVVDPAPEQPEVPEPEEPDPGDPAPDPTGPEPIQLEITFDGNGGVPASTTCVVSEGDSPPFPTVTRDGYTFAGWIDGRGVLLDGPLKEVTVLVDETFTASWVPVSAPPDPDTEPVPSKGGWVAAIIGALVVIAAAIATWLGGAP